jgi:hypothetical protein
MEREHMATAMVVAASPLRLRMLPSVALRALPLLSLWMYHSISLSAQCCCRMGTNQLQLSFVCFELMLELEAFSLQSFSSLQCCVLQLLMKAA